MKNRYKPKGATHWHKKCEWACASWLKQVYDNWFVWYDIGELGEWLHVEYPDWLDKTEIQKVSQ